MDNQLVASGKPEKLNIATGEASERTWGIPLEKLGSGIYRVDILVGDEVAWRQYFKVSE